MASASIAENMPAATSSATVMLEQMKWPTFEFTKAIRAHACMAQQPSSSGLLQRDGCRLDGCGRHIIMVTQYYHGAPVVGKRPRPGGQPALGQKQVAMLEKAAVPVLRSDPDFETGSIIFVFKKSTFASKTVVGKINGVTA